MNIDKPSKVINAERLLYCSLGIGLLGSVVGKYIYPAVFTERIVILLMRCIIPLFLIYMIGKGKNWARITFLIVFFFSILGTFIGIGNIYNGLNHNLETAQPVINFYLLYNAVYIVIQGVACAFLSQRSSLDWFRKIKELNESTQPTSNN